MAKYNTGQRFHLADGEVVVRGHFQQAGQPTSTVNEAELDSA